MAVDVSGPGMSEEALPRRVGVWDRVRPLRASDEIVRQFRRAVFEGRVRAGDSLGSERQLAEQFGVSRSTVRDALRTLEASGVIEIRTGVKGGVRVAQGEPLRFADILAMQLQLTGVQREDVVAAQLGLEAVAARLAAERATEQDLAEILLRLADSAELAGLGVYRETGFGFHEAVARASHNWVIITALRAVHDLRREAPAMGPARQQRRADHLLRVHREIYQSIAERDGEKAARLMREHLQAYLNPGAAHAH